MELLSDRFRDAASGHHDGARAPGHDPRPSPTRDDEIKRRRRRPPGRGRGGEQAEEIATRRGRPARRTFSLVSRLYKEGGRRPRSSSSVSPANLYPRGPNRVERARIKGMSTHRTTIGPFRPRSSSRSRRASAGPGARSPTRTATAGSAATCCGRPSAWPPAKGYEGTRVADIVAEAGLSKSTFYEHFSSKEDCFVELHRRTSAQMLSGAVDTAEATIDERPLRVPGRRHPVVRRLRGPQPAPRGGAPGGARRAQPVVRTQREENMRRTIVHFFVTLGPAPRLPARRRRTRAHRDDPRPRRHGHPRRPPP